ncbi:MAG: sugar ABC transporter ATP-binding protein [Lachnoclostridium sp.]|jgi:ABC-type sugar transport system ATPase subunit|nr:sugar ABC transporter ATP-binding protein [Lachnoclostridium sp.]
MSTLLEMKNIDKSFGSNMVLQNVSIKIDSGEVLALLGENGAGKSTLIKILGGIYSRDKGDIYINGSEVRINSVADAREHGVSVIHQELMLCPNVTIAENIFIGNELHGKGGFVHLKKQIEMAQEKINRYGLPLEASMVLNRLTIAQQQMVEIIRAVSFGSKIIVMDEPTSSLTENEVKILFSMIKKLKSEGVGIIYISHRLEEIFEITDRVSVLRDGQNAGTFLTGKSNKEELVAAMVGRELSKYYIKDSIPSDEIIMSVKNLSDGKIVKNVSFDLKKGEILGLSGLVGAGRSETMECLFGLRKAVSGTIKIADKEVIFKKPKQAMDCGIGFVPEDRKNEGLFPSQSVKFNGSITILSQLFRRLRYFKTKENSMIDKMIKSVQIKVTGKDQNVGELSGGNQQKVMIGKWLISTKKILILDEPTRGVDVKTKAEIYSLINNLAKSGLTIIMVSSELPELMNMCDRIVVLSRGYSTGTLQKDEFDQKKIMMYATQEV